jgi:hypothetical protein
MLFFPQLQTGAMAQYPLARRHKVRTVVNELLDGRQVKYFDSGATRVHWQFQFAGLTDAELQALQTLFDNCEGRLNTFTLLDPADNLFAWSETFSNAAWTVGPLLTLSASDSDPWGTTRATRIVNNGAAVQEVMQTLGIPANYQYCLSAWARGSAFTLARGPQRIDVPASAEWRRVVASGQNSVTGDLVAAGIEIPSGGDIEIAGMQLEAQIAPGGYRRTSSRHGVYPATRFEEDAFTVKTVSPANHSVTLRLVSALSS